MSHGDSRHVIHAPAKGYQQLLLRERWHFFTIAGYVY